MQFFEYSGLGQDGRLAHEDEGAARAWLARHFKDERWLSQDHAFVSWVMDPSVKVPGRVGLVAEDEGRVPDALKGVSFAGAQKAEAEAEPRRGKKEPTS